MFRKELEELINRHSLESASDTPDFILAQYLDDCLLAFDLAVRRREQWYGRFPRTAPMVITEPQADGDCTGDNGGML